MVRATRIGVGAIYDRLLLALLVSHNPALLMAKWHQVAPLLSHLQVSSETHGYIP